MLRCVAITLLLCLVPTLLLARDDPHAGKTLAIVDGYQRWLDADELAGFPGYIVKYKAYAGDKLVSEAELSVIKGCVANAASTRTRGIWNPYTGKLRKETRVTSLLFMECPAARKGQSREEYLGLSPHFVNGAQAYVAQLYRTEKFSFGGLDLYVYSDSADRFEVEIYHNDFHGFVIDDSRGGIPLAKLRAPTVAELIGTFSGVLHPSAEKMIVNLPEMQPDPMFDSEGRRITAGELKWEPPLPAAKQQ